MRLGMIVAALLALSGCASMQSQQEAHEWCADGFGYPPSSQAYKDCRARWDRVQQSRRIEGKQ
jgi:hypothetical protein